MEYKLSIYNIRFSKDENEFLYNSFSGALIKLDIESLNLFNKMKMEISFEKNVISQNFFNFFLQCGFIVEKNIDEQQLYLKQVIDAVNNDSVLRLVIAPTMDCNFRCKYCYEKHNKLYMSDDVQNGIIEYLKQRLKEDKIEKVLICWYGGEPLLAIKIINKLSKQFIKICDDYKKKYYSIMVTNGYLLNSKIIDSLITCRVKNLQVTIDGTREEHGKRRILNGNVCLNTYDNILEGIKLASENGIDINIRMNIDNSNIDNIFKAINEINDKIISKKNVRIYLGKLFCMTDMEMDLKDIIVNSKRFINSSLESSYLCKSLGFKIYKKDILPKKRLWFCPSAHGNSVVIDPNGNIYFCWNDIGIEKYSIGKLKNGYNEINDIEFNKWMRMISILQKKCQYCEVLPLCSGGCLRECVHFNHEPVCDDRAKNMIFILKKYLERRSDHGNNY